MKVSYQQLTAIIKIMATVMNADQSEDQEVQNIVRFLEEFKLDNDKNTELIQAANQMKLEDALSIMHKLDRPTQQELSNRLFNLILVDGSISDQEGNFFEALVKHFDLPLPDSQEWKELISTTSGETADEELLSNEEKKVVTASGDDDAQCFFVIEPSGNDAYFMGKCLAYIRSNRKFLSKEEIARDILKCKKSTLFEYKNPPVLQAVTEDMGYTNYGIFRAYIARLPSDQRENKAASKLLGKKVLGPCLIQFVSNEGVFQYLPKKYCLTFHKYLKTRLDCPMTYSYEYARILCPTL